MKQRSSVYLFCAHVNELANKGSLYPTTHTQIPMAARGGNSPPSLSAVVAATFKVLVLGNSQVGKTSLIRLYSKGEFVLHPLPTIG